MRSSWVILFFIFNLYFICYFPFFSSSSSSGACVLPQWKQMTLVEQMKVGVREKEKWPHGITNIPTRSDSGIGRRLRTSKQNKRMDKLKHEVQRCARSHARSEAAFVRRQGRAFTSIHTRIQHEINIQRVNTWLTVRYVREPLLLSVVSIFFKFFPSRRTSPSKCNRARNSQTTHFVILLLLLLSRFLIERRHAPYKVSTRKEKMYIDI